MRRIASIQAVSDATLALRWADGTTSIVDFRRIIEQGGVFAPLADPLFFALATVDLSGRFIAWPGELDFCADALYIADMALVAQ